jgi:hypothetical protein
VALAITTIFAARPAKASSICKFKGSPNYSAQERAMTTHVTQTTAAPSEIAVKHFQEMLAFETDCWDVHESLKSANPDFIVVDVRGQDAFAKGHVKGARSTSLTAR